MNQLDNYDEIRKLLLARPGFRTPVACGVAIGRMPGRWNIPADVFFPDPICDTEDPATLILAYVTGYLNTTCHQIVSSHTLRRIISWFPSEAAQTQLHIETLGQILTQIAIDPEKAVIVCAISPRDAQKPPANFADAALRSDLLRVHGKRGIPSCFNMQGIVKRLPDAHPAW